MNTFLKEMKKEEDKQRKEINLYYKDYVNLNYKEMIIPTQLRHKEQKEKEAVRVGE